MASSSGCLFSKIAELEPRIPARGVRRSWEMARNRVLLILSFSESTMILLYHAFYFTDNTLPLEFRSIGSMLELTLTGNMLKQSPEYFSLSGNSFLCIITGKPIGPQDLAPIFPMELIKQEVSTERWIEIPDEIHRAYKLYRPTPLHRAHRLEKALKTNCRIYYKNESVSPPGSHKPNTAIAPAYYNKEEVTLQVLPFRLSLTN